jgi:hypothetical protein
MDGLIDGVLFVATAVMLFWCIDMFFRVRKIGEEADEQIGLCQAAVKYVVENPGAVPSTVDIPPPSQAHRVPQA